jgi:cytidylate kinase
MSGVMSIAGKDMFNMFRGRGQQHPSAKMNRIGLQRTRPIRHTTSSIEAAAQEPLPSGIPPEESVVITISRQFGSGGSEIGRLVAGETGLLYVDHEIIGEVARRLGITTEQAVRQDEQTVGAVRHVLEALQSSSFFALNLGTLMNPRQPPAYSRELVYWRLTRRVILEMATKGNAVIIGRGSQFLLHDSPRTLHIYIFAPLEQRIANVMEFNHLSREEATRMVQHRDYEHEAYLRRYYGRDQDRPELYHLLINTGLFPYNLAARLIRETLPLVGTFGGLRESKDRINEASDMTGADDTTEKIRPVGAEGTIATEESTETKES